jgi:hypothetical protein
MNLKKLEEELLEYNQPSNDKNPTDQPGKRYNASTGRMTAAKAKTQRITRKDRMDLVNSKDLNTLKGQIDASFKLILAAADNTPVESFLIGQLNIMKKRLNQRIDKEMQKQKK